MSGEIKESVHDDLAAERAASTLDSEEFANWWIGSREILLKKRAAEQHFFDDPELQDTQHSAHMSHAEFNEFMIVRNVKYIKKLKKWLAEQDDLNLDVKKTGNITGGVNENLLSIIGNISRTLFPQAAPLGLHASMFIPAILNNATEEQQREWLPKARNMDGWIGCYAQTELGHGSFIRGLETRADYDMRRQEFILNAPTISAYKWWPGTLGNFSTKAILSAQLHINGKSYGLQQFLVPIRDEQTHEPLPGVDVGEIGPRIGMNGANNGFLGLKNVRIPRTYMLMKHAQVQPSGKFVQSSEPILLYGTMMYVRVGIVRDVSYGLLLAGTIATRYSIVRRQSPLAANEEEPKILDHMTQQIKIIPQIAKGVVFQLTAKNLWTSYSNVVQELSKGDSSNLAQMHALSCILKALCSNEAEEGIEVLRKSCGGHGYLASANFGVIYGIVTAACTYEGENTVLFLQTARFLMKMMGQRKAQLPLPYSVAYLLNRVSDVRSINVGENGGDLMLTLILILESATAALIQHAYDLQQMHSNETGAAHAPNKTGMYLVKAAIAHGHCYLARGAYLEYQKLYKNDSKYSAALVGVVSQLLELYVIDTFLAELANILRYSSKVNANHVAWIETRYEQLLTLLRPNILSVVDGFDYHDRTLNSTLGAYDGFVYERLMSEAHKNPLNQAKAQTTFRKHLKELMPNKL